MLTIKEQGLLIYIIEHCKRIEEKTINATRETLDENKDIEEIVCFNILQIGELAKGFGISFLTKHNGAPWKTIKGMRDVVAHGYGTINLDKVWKVVSEEIKPLREYCESILESDN